MKILLSIIIASILLTLPTVAQKPDSMHIGIPVIIDPQILVYPNQEAPVQKVKTQPDTSLILLHANHVKIRSSAGVEYITYEGDVQARILGYYIIADWVEVVSDPMRIVAEGNAAVMSDDMAEFVKRFEWKKSDPDSPVIEIRRPSGGKGR